MRTALDRSNATATLRVDGDLDTTAAPGLRRAVLHLLHREPPRCLILDLTDVSFLSVRAALELAECARAAERAHGRLLLVSRSPAVLRALSVTGVAPRLTVYAEHGAAASAASIAATAE
ncbi:MAG: STAS domain-containing protein [Sciscionella sp.]